MFARERVMEVQQMGYVSSFGVPSRRVASRKHQRLPVNPVEHVQAPSCPSLARRLKVVMCGLCILDWNTW